MDIQQLEVPSGQDDDSGYFRHEEDRSKVRSVVRGRVYEQECCFGGSRGLIGAFGGYSDIQQIKVFIRQDDNSGYFRHGEDQCGVRIAIGV